MQIGLVVLVGLACKNAILIVEYAKQMHLEGRSRFEATLEACRLRLRPILMTSFAFILGVVPLVVAAGAGAEMRRSLGTAVFSGMLGVTLFGIFLTPVFFSVIQGLERDVGCSRPPPCAGSAPRWSAAWPGRGSAFCSRGSQGRRRSSVLGDRARRRRGSPGRAGRCWAFIEMNPVIERRLARQAHSPPPHLKLGAARGEHQS